ERRDREGGVRAKLLLPQGEAGRAGGRMNDTRERLEEETGKWRGRLEDRLQEVSYGGEEGEEMVENARAYLEDSRHFEREDDLVRAFESVVWGWAWLEIGEKLNILSTDHIE
ncbi:MAG: DUF357 domain-containing protein, partial [Candidatus Nanohaloarchaea archaeon]|nr:DUF357 domain-containing protein [Candidatus Nanohaloarchaea archaeon]